MSLPENCCQTMQENSCDQENLPIGVIGGSGICSIPGLRVTDKVSIPTRYGDPSDKIFLGEYHGVCIAFIPRHGYSHTIPPHRVPYKANLTALKLLGVRHVVATCVAGSLRKEITPGTIMVPDQFINFTWGRDDTFAHDRELVHLPMASPYCDTLALAATNALSDLDIEYRKGGTVTVIQGPRFSTIAESKMYALLGGDIVNMTQYPECYFARELGLCYTVLASVTDYDVGVPSDIAMRANSFDKVLPIFRSNVENTLQVLRRILLNASQFVGCSCAELEVKPYFASKS